MLQKTALICGISGQDGSYLARFLLNKGYIVWGTSRDAQGSSFPNHIKLGIKARLSYISMIPEDFRSVLVAFRKCKPDEVYYLAGQSSVGLSFEQPAETIQSFAIGMLNILESCRMMEKEVRVYHAGSSECFGFSDGKPATELTPFHPVSPYAVAKVSAFWLVDNYRSAYNIFACTGILFNHESPLRPLRFVTQKIIATAKKISEGSEKKLILGRLDVFRDWGWAPEYVEAMWLMLQQPKPEDYVISTGECNSLQNFVKITFGKLGLNWEEYVEQSEKYMRPTDLMISLGNPSKAESNMGWKANTKLEDIIEMMLFSSI